MPIQKMRKHMLTKLKAKVQSAIKAQASIAHKVGLTPNMVSFTGAAQAFLAAFAYTLGREQLPWAVLLLLLSGYCDMLDGAIARLHHKVTSFGGFLDSLLDRYADSAIYTGIILGGFCTIPWGLMALIGSLLVSYARARGEAANIKMESVGLAERPERIIILVAASIAEIYLMNAIETAIIAIAILTHITVLQRSLHVRGTLKGGKTKDNL
ncbi:MAG: archaetidylinositol phosphate synthase [Candidatus Bathyarchaeota archaeon]|nr:archaetidylinositol phosphate synthase [Candidatus Bathyarchaeota archaeon]